MRLFEAELAAVKKKAEARPKRENKEIEMNEKVKTVSLANADSHWPLYPGTRASYPS